MVDGLPPHRYYAWALVALLVVSLLYLGGLGLTRRLGLPLDDAWIHQTFARNLVRYSQFAYMPGHISTGSTAPIWTMMLAPAYLLGLDPLAWSYAMGILLLFALGLGVFRLGVRLFPQRAGWAALAGLAVLLEWHMAWAAFSGMETLLFACGVVWLTERYLSWEMGQRRDLPENSDHLNTPFVLGLLSGLLILVRPEGILLTALMAVGGWLARRRRSWQRTLTIAIDGAAGLSLLMVPYVAFNLIASGTLFPNTFYAKQLEYAVLLRLPFWVRLWRVILPTLTGAQVVLLPGAVYAVIAMFRPQSALPLNPYLGRWARLMPLLWWLLTTLSYALRLPVNYQHGRYMMPTIPFLMLGGAMGTLAWLRPQSSHLLVRVISRAVPIMTVLLLTTFLVLGARALITDVGIINGEMVAVSQWLNRNAPAHALIAAHDIGAIGYFTQRPLLDLAGLVSPQMIPFIRDEAKIAELMFEQEVDYLVTFPSWYPRLVTDDRLTLVYQTHCELTRDLGQDNMAVYRLRR